LSSNSFSFYPNILSYSPPQYEKRNEQCYRNFLLRILIPRVVKELEAGRPDSAVKATTSTPLMTPLTALFSPTCLDIKEVLDHDFEERKNGKWLWRSQEITDLLHRYGVNLRYVYEYLFLL